MKTLLKILSGGFVVFLVLAMTEEREVFLAPFRSDPEPVVSEETAEELEAKRLAEAEPAIASVREFLTIAGHFYASTGDTRFSDRLPASPAVVEEIRTEIVYLLHNRRRQEMSLMNLAVLDAEVRDHLAVVRTREHWILRTFLVPGGEEADPPRSTICQVEYRLAREGQRWVVVEWDLSRPADQAG